MTLLQIIATAILIIVVGAIAIITAIMAANKKYSNNL